MSRRTGRRTAWSADFSVADNLILDVYDQPPFASGIALNLDAIRESAVKRVEEYDVRTTSTTTPAGTLSGGNQQKVVVAREMSRDVKLMIVSQPTRGLDVGSIEFVHKRLVAQRDEGVAVLIVSSELDEIYALADRIAVMYRGPDRRVLPAHHLRAGTRPADGRQ